MAPNSKEYLPIVADDGPMDERATYCYCKGSATKRAISSRFNMTSGSALLVGILIGFALRHFMVIHQGAPVYGTDLALARKAVEQEQVRFSSSPVFDDKGLASFNFTEGQTLRYTGLPVEAVDKAWEDLIGTRYFLISDQEAFRAWGPEYKEYYSHPDIPGHKGGYIAGLDVLHTLHCVNKLRIALYKDHYPVDTKSSHNFKQYHIDHCLEIIRQSVQCHGDLTPIPTRWWPGFGKQGRDFIDSDQVHTCRKFSKIRDWTLEWEKGHPIDQDMPPPPTVE